MTTPNEPSGRSLVGLFADEPEIVDEVCRMAMEARRRDPLRARSEGTAAAERAPTLDDPVETEDREPRPAQGAQ